MLAIDSLTTGLISTALDAASLRQQVLASNIANAGRPDYVAQSVSFEATLSSLADRGSSSVSRLAEPGFGLQARVHADRLADGSPRPIQLDQEVGALTLNSMHYQSLVRGLNKYLSLVSIAVADGKR